MFRIVQDDGIAERTLRLVLPMTTVPLLVDIAGMVLDLVQAFRAAVAKLLEYTTQGTHLLQCLNISHHCY